LDEGEQAIHDKLSARFQPSELLVQDVSGGCGTFYAITIASAAFKGIPVVKQHRLVNEALKKEIEGIHGLQVR
ncbi:bola protein, partial [Lactifluus subvellereus]